MRFSKDDGNLYDVVAVGLDSNKILWVEKDKTLPSAEAIQVMAVARQGVEDRFFAISKAGFYQRGDIYGKL